MSSEENEMGRAGLMGWDGIGWKEGAPEGRLRMGFVQLSLLASPSYCLDLVHPSVLSCRMRSIWL